MSIKFGLVRSIITLFYILFTSTMLLIGAANVSSIQTIEGLSSLDIFMVNALTLMLLIGIVATIIALVYTRHFVKNA